MKHNTLFAIALFSGFVFSYCGKEMSSAADGTPIITFHCPGDITVHTTGSVGFVKYAPPDSLFTNCDLGGLSIFLVSGLPSDEYFPVGATVVVQKVSDACGNTATCSFTVTVLKGNGGNCAAPTNLTTTGITSSSATFNWSAVAGAANYTVEWKINSSSVWYTAGTTTTNTYTISNLVPGKTYYWRVKADCFPDYSTSVSFLSLTDCNNSYNPDVEFVPYNVGKQLIFRDSSGLLRDTLTVEQFTNVPVTYYEMGYWCTREIEMHFVTNWKNISGEPLKLKFYSYGFFGHPDRIISTAPDDFVSKTFFWAPGFGTNNGRVIDLNTYDFAGQTYQNVLLARCGEPGDTGYTADKCNCPFMKKMIFSRDIGLVAYETAAGKWILE